MEGLRGHTSGYAIPTYVVDAPGGGGKIPVRPQYVISQAPGKVVLRNFEGFITTYNEPNDYTGHTTARPERALPNSERGQEGVAGLLAGVADNIKPEGFDRVHQRLGDVTWEPYARARPVSRLSAGRWQRPGGPAGPCERSGDGFRNGNGRHTAAPDNGPWQWGPLQRLTMARSRSGLMGLNVAVLANLKKNAPRFEGMPADAWDDLDSDITVNAIVAALESCGHRATFLEGNLSLVETLPQLKPDICFNICEGHWGDSRESHVPALLEMLRMPYTGSRVLTLALTLDKPMTKRVLAFHGLPTPAFQVFERADEPLDADLRFPLFVKPSREGTGHGCQRRFDRARRARAARTAGRAPGQVPTSRSWSSASCVGARSRSG